MNGFLKFFKIGVINRLPKIVGVQSEHANPVYKYYLEPDPEKRKFIPVNVKNSVAQAAMIGNPVSMPRVIHLANLYNEAAGEKAVHMVQVSEQAIMDWELCANRNGHIACTQGGESLAGLVTARKQGIINKNETAILDSTAHALKFAGFTDMYFNDNFPAEFNISPDTSLINAPVLISPEGIEKLPAQGKPLKEKDLKLFIKAVAKDIADVLNVTSK